MKMYFIHYKFKNKPYTFSNMKRLSYSNKLTGRACVSLSNKEHCSRSHHKIISSSKQWNLHFYFMLKIGKNFPILEQEKKIIKECSLLIYKIKFYVLVIIKHGQDQMEKLLVCNENIHIAKSN